MRPPTSYRYLDAITAVFITTLLVSNLVASKNVLVFGLHFGVAVFIFPVSYVFGDILTEVYGYARSRRVIWLGFASVGLAGAIFYLCDIAPPAPEYRHQEAFHVILGPSPYVLVSSMVAYFCGEFCNSYVMAKMKIWSNGRFLWMRTIGSTLVGEGVDSVVFYPLAFLVFPLVLGFDAGRWPVALVLAVTLHNYLAKVFFEVAVTPATYALVKRLKRSEGIDVYDHKTNFNPFALGSRQ